MKELIEHIVKALVDDPSQVSVTEVTTGADVLLELRVGPGDMGRVIGRGGKVISAMRTLAQMCAAREAKRAHLELVED
ncbi:MAG: KH domain-containing protein [Anaerolineales bacterium]